MDNNRDAEQLARHINSMGAYLDVRVLPDGSVAAVGDLLTTRAIFLGCNAWGYERRFCFADRQLALQRFAELQSEDDMPAGFIASRPKMQDEIDRNNNP